MSRSRRIGLGATVALLASVFAILSAEIAVRVFALGVPLAPTLGHYIRDPHLPYRPKPLSTVTGDTGEYEYVFAHNSFGFRDIEYQLRKPEGTFRILAVGDSFTYGYGATDTESYPSIVETRLNAAASGLPKVEVINAGIARFFPEPERILLEHYGVPFDPDLILVGIGPNDVSDTFLGLDAVTPDASGFLRTRQAAALGDFGSFVYRYSAFGRLVLRVYLDWRQPRPEWTEMYKDGGTHEKDWVTMETEYARMAEIAASIGAKLVLVHIPQHFPHPGTGWDEGHRYMPRRMSVWAATRGVGFVDVLPAMEAQPAQETLYYAEDGHCTPAGYAIVANTVVSYLIGQGLVPGADQLRAPASLESPGN